MVSPVFQVMVTVAAREGTAIRQNKKIIERNVVMVRMVEVVGKVNKGAAGRFMNELIVSCSFFDRIGAIGVPACFPRYVGVLVRSFLD